MTDSKDTTEQAAAEKKPAEAPENARRRAWHSPWFLPGVVAALGAIAVGASVAGAFLFGEGWATSGQIGDSAAPLTSMLTVAVLILTARSTESAARATELADRSVQMQRKELQLQRKELRLQRLEMRQQRKALQEQAVSQKEQAAAQQALAEATERQTGALLDQEAAQRAQAEALQAQAEALRAQVEAQRDQIQAQAEAQRAQMQVQQRMERASLLLANTMQIAERSSDDRYLIALSAIAAAGGKKADVDTVLDRVKDNTSKFNNLIAETETALKEVQTEVVAAALAKTIAAWKATKDKE